MIWLHFSQEMTWSSIDMFNQLRYYVRFKFMAQLTNNMCMEPVCQI